MMEQKGYDRAQREANERIQSKDNELRAQRLALAKAKAKETTLQLKVANLDSLLYEERTRSYHMLVEITKLKKDILDLHQKGRESQDVCSSPGRR